MYDATIGKTFQLDPVGEKYYEFSSYSWVANNPIRYIDPTGMVIENGSQKEWDNQKKAVENRRDQLQGKIDKLNTKATAKGWSATKLANKTGNLTDRVSSLNTSLKTMGTLESSKQVYSLSHTAPGQNGGITLDTKTNVIDIKFGSTANFVHESTHAGQFETQDIAFDGKTGDVLAQDIGDEIAGYKAQFAYDPSSISGLSSSAGVANSFGAITSPWVQGLAGGTLYNPGGSANTGASHLDINSTKVDFIRAYPTNPGAMKALPNNFTLRTSYPNIYYKKP
jgi:hypothetical protein